MSWSDLLLGFIQGAAEFLPVSSSGHLFLIEKILNDTKPSLSFILLLHLATLLAVVAVFFKDIKSFALGFWQKPKLQLFFKLCLALAPLIFVGLFFKSFVEQSFEKNTVALGFFSTGGLLLSLFFIRSHRLTHQNWLTRWIPSIIQKRQNLSLEKMSYFQAFLIGSAQALAVLPGFSRSAWTISIGLYCGLSPRAAVYFSFLISLPAIAGSSAMNFAGYFFKPSSAESLSLPLLETLSLSFALAFISGFLSLLLILRMAQSQRLYLFSFYLLPLSFLVFFFL